MYNTSALTECTTVMSRPDLLPAAAVLPIMGVLLIAVCHASATLEVLWASPACNLPCENQVTSKSPVGDISVVTLIRTDITLDHSQKAEKV